jgi:DNA-binding transcriptional MerR regulator
MKGRNMISAKGIVKRYNISYQTLNNYTNLGLLIVRKRKGNGRLYRQEEVKRRLETITKLKNRGYPLKLIRNMF